GWGEPLSVWCLVVFFFLMSSRGSVSAGCGCDGGGVLFSSTLSAASTEVGRTVLGEPIGCSFFFDVVKGKCIGRMPMLRLVRFFVLRCQRRRLRGGEPSSVSRLAVLFSLMS